MIDFSPKIQHNLPEVALIADGRAVTREKSFFAGGEYFMLNTEFAAFLKQKKAREAPNGRVDWERRKSIWLAKIDSLFQELGGWLAPYKQPDEGEPLLDFFTEEIEINEEFLGTYPVPSMKIRLGSEEVNLKPVGSIILGGLGRIDMIGPLGTILILLNDTDQRPGLKVTISPAIPPNRMKSVAVDFGVSGTESKRSIEERMESSTWYFVPPHPRGDLLRVTEESFTEMLRSMVRQ
ncbi:MAG: hypothetical protein HQL64_16940 [Magnetococcales bacterium]|nr:hypothetical protein [Magnetococcales bacterium]